MKKRKGHIFIFLFLVAGAGLCQDIVLTGNVTNKAASPLAGVDVVFAKYGISAVTDASGNFSLSGPALSLNGSSPGEKNENTLYQIQ